MNSLEQDVIVVGSGFGACPPAVELARRGRQVVMLERGRRWKPEEFHPTQDAKEYALRIDAITGHNAGVQAPRAVGGGSIVYSCTSFRAPSESFEHVDRRNHRKFWPDSINRRVLDPYYAKCEAALNVIQFGWEQMPKKGVVFARFLTKGGMGVDLARAAMVDGCGQYGFCRYGCPNSAKNDLTTNYIPEAERLGVQIWEETTVERLRPRKQGYELEVIKNGERQAIRAKTVVLAAGTWGTAQLLMRSRGHLPRLSRQVGRDFHANGNLLFGFILNENEWPIDLYKGRENPGVYSFSNWRDKRITLLTCSLLPLEVFGAAQVHVDGAPEPLFYGRDHKRFIMEKFQHRFLAMETCGLPDAPYLDFKLDGDVAKPVGRYDELYFEYFQRNKEIAEGLARANDARMIRSKILVGGAPFPDHLTFSNHQLGSCKIGAGPETGVIDESGEVFHYPGLFVTDGAAIPGPLGVNPSLTVLAMSELLTARMIQRRF